MLLGCGSQVLKFFIFATNAIVCVSSIFFVIVAIHGLATDYIPSQLPEIIRHSVTLDRHGLIMLAILCSLSALISCIGCCGAWNENRGMLLAFAIIMFIFIILIVASQIAVSASYKALGKAVERVMTDYYEGKVDNETVNDFKAIERTLHCCGPSDKLKKEWIGVNGCRDNETIWDDETVCSQVLLSSFGIGALVVTLLLLFAAVVSMSTACCLRSAIVDRGSYTAFS